MDRALLDRVEKQAWFHRFRRGGPFLLFLLTALGTVLSVVGLERSENERLQLELDKQTTEVAAAVQRRAAEHIAILNAAAAVFSSRDEVTQQEFASFGERLRATGAYRGSLGIGWAERIPSGALTPFEERVRGRGLPSFIVYPVPRPGAGMVVPILFLDPLDAANRRAIGFDMYSEPERRKAMDLAVRHGQPVTSGLVQLAQDRNTRARPGFLIFMPVFEGAAGQRQLKGFVYSPFRADEFLRSAAELYGHRDLQVSLYDGQVADDRQMAQSALGAGAGAGMERSINVGLRTWVLRVSTSHPQSLSVLSRLTLAFGFILSILVLVIARMVARRAAEDRQVLEWLTRQAAIRTSLTRELNHRVKNTLANVLSIVSLTRRRSKNLDDFAESLIGRVRALSATHDLLSQSDWSFAAISEVVRSELAPYMDEHGDHVVMLGPEVSLAPNDALSLGLAVHELATNAAKYGALSTPDGRVSVTWKLLKPELAEVRWLEEGGPAVQRPSRRGFGLDLLEKVVSQELKSDVNIDFDERGVKCRLCVPVRQRGDFSLRAPQAVEK